MVLYIHLTFRYRDVHVYMYNMSHVPHICSLQAAVVKPQTTACATRDWNV